MFGKLLNVLTKGKFNPLIGAAGISAFPMAARVVNRVGLEEDYDNFLADACDGREHRRADIAVGDCGRDCVGAAGEVMHKT